MITTGYSLEEAGPDVLKKIHDMGWAVYDSTESHSPEDAEQSIRNGPVRNLQQGRRYVMIPRVTGADARDPSKVFSRLEKVTELMHREVPSITLEGYRWPWTGFIPGKDSVKINTTQGHQTTYVEFLDALNTIFQL